MCVCSQSVWLDKIKKNKDNFRVNFYWWISSLETPLAMRLLKNALHYKTFRMSFAFEHFSRSLNFAYFFPPPNFHETVDLRNEIFEGIRLCSETDIEWDRSEENLVYTHQGDLYDADRILILNGVPWKYPVLRPNLRTELSLTDWIHPSVFPLRCMFTNLPTHSINSETILSLINLFVIRQANWTTWESAIDWWKK